MAKAKAKKGSDKKSKKPKVVKAPMPKLVCDNVQDNRKPLLTEASGRLAASLTTYREKVVEWKAECKAHIAGGGNEADMPVFNPKHFLDTSKGAMTQAALDKMLDDEANDKPFVRAPRYNPIVVEALLEMKPPHRIHRQPKVENPPKDWDEDLLGNWWHEWEENGETVQEPSGWIFNEKMPRLMHSKDVASLVIDQEKNILSFGNNRYVVGDGTAVRASFMLISAPTRAMYKAGDSIRKRMAMAGNKDVTDIVHRIEDRPNNGGGFTLKGNWKEGIRETVVLPGQAMTAGFLFDSDGKRLTAKQIRALDSKTTGLKFKTVKQVLGGPILGKRIPFSATWKELQVVDKENIAKMRKRKGRSVEWEKGSPEYCALEGHRVTCRVGPHEDFCFGFRAAQVDMVPVKLCGGDDPAFTFVIGDRSDIEYVDKKTVEVESETTTKATKKSTKKSTKKASKPKPVVDEAPPVEAETENEVEVEAEVEVDTEA